MTALWREADRDLGAGGCRGVHVVVYIRMTVNGCALKEGGYFADDVVGHLGVELKRVSRYAVCSFTRKVGIGKLR